MEKVCRSNGQTWCAGRYGWTGDEDESADRGAIERVNSTLSVERVQRGEAKKRGEDLKEAQSEACGGTGTSFSARN
ncbi:hypothetical protein KM043_001355 [Ampulex compressa]|nr:hypothetical protein KM043_001355 [Ampulex compressa]